MAAVVTVEPVGRAGAKPDAVWVIVVVTIDPWELVVELVVVGVVEVEGVTTTTTVLVLPDTSVDADDEGIPAIPIREYTGNSHDRELTPNSSTNIIRDTASPSFIIPTLILSARRIRRVAP